MKSRTKENHDVQKSCVFFCLTCSLCLDDLDLGFAELVLKYEPDAGEEF